jgi:hypothetical protein
MPELLCCGRPKVDVASIQSALWLLLAFIMNCRVWPIVSAANLLVTGSPLAWSNFVTKLPNNESASAFAFSPPPSAA